MKKILSVCFIGTVLTLGTLLPSASAEELVPYRRATHLSPADWRFVRKFVLNKYSDAIEISAEKHKLTKEQGLEHLRRHNLWTGLYDLNSDGAPELFLTIVHGYECGTAGCSTNIFYKDKEGQWVIFTGLSALFDRRVGHPNIEVTGEKIRGYKTILGGKYGLRWNGWEYEEFCIRKC